MKRPARHWLIAANGAACGLNAICVVLDVATGGWVWAAVAVAAAALSGLVAARLWRYRPHHETSVGERAMSTGERPTPAAKEPDTTIGFRYWMWSMTRRELRSPSQHTLWEAPELRCEAWDETEVVRGCAGIHAALLPTSWHEGTPEVAAPMSHRATIHYGMSGPEVIIPISGIVERFGRYVLGTEGWRAEWVIIRKLLAPTDEIGLQLETKFPDVEVVYVNRA